LVQAIHIFIFEKKWIWHRRDKSPGG